MRYGRRLRLSLRRCLADRGLLRLLRLPRRGLSVHLLRLCLLGRRIAARRILCVTGASSARASTRNDALWDALWWTTDPLYTFRRSPSWTQSALEIPLCTATTRELLVALCFRFRAVATSNWCSAGRLWDYSLRWETLFVVRVTAVYGIVALQKITTSMSASYHRKRTTKRREGDKRGGS